MGSIWTTWIKVLPFSTSKLTMTTSIWLCLRDCQRVLMLQRLLSDSGKLSMALNKLHGYGKTMSLLFYSLLDSDSSQLIPTSISPVMVYWYFCLSMIAPCYIRRPRLWLPTRTNWTCRRNTRSSALACHSNSLALWCTVMTLVPESVLVRMRISPQSWDTSH